MNIALALQLPLEGRALDVQMTEPVDKAILSVEDNIVNLGSVCQVDSIIEMTSMFALSWSMSLRRDFEVNARTSSEVLHFVTLPTLRVAVGSRPPPMLWLHASEVPHITSMIPSSTGFRVIPVSLQRSVRFGEVFHGSRFASAR